VNPDSDFNARSNAAKGKSDGHTTTQLRPMAGRGPFVANLAHDPELGSAGPLSSLAPGHSNDASESRVLVVGPGISVQGTVQNAERLLVEGCMEASTIRAKELSIARGGLFKGEVDVEDAEIFGTMEGMLTARGILVVRGTGRVLGTAHCHRLQVDDGGQITAEVDMIAK
jgi:cytoskeletal protein CcmA (bactofilin family)